MTTSEKAEALRNLLDAAVATHRTLMRLGFEGPTLRQLTEALAGMDRAFLRESARETILRMLRLAESALQREPDDDASARGDRPAEARLTYIAEGHYHAHVGGKVYLYCHDSRAEDSWHIAELFTP